MSALPIDAIKIGSRFRQDHGGIGALARSIEAVGLLHPIVVTRHGQLLAGRRRRVQIAWMGDDPGYRHGGA